MKILPKNKRTRTYGRVTSTVTQYPACAAATASGNQCIRTANTTGAGGGWVMVDGVKTPLCTTHFEKAKAEGYKVAEVTY